MYSEQGNCSVEAYISLIVVASTKEFSLLVNPICTPIDIGFQLLQILANTWYCLLFNFNNSDGYMMISHYSLISIFSDDPYYLSSIYVVTGHFDIVFPEIPVQLFCQILIDSSLILFLVFLLYWVLWKVVYWSFLVWLMFFIQYLRKLWLLHVCKGMFLCFPLQVLIFLPFALSISCLELIMCVWGPFFPMWLSSCSCAIY